MTNYDIEASRLARQIHRLSRETRGQARGSQAAYRSVELTDGPVVYYDEHGVARLQIGAVDENGAFTIVELNGDQPPVPTVPDLTAYPGGVSIAWDGTFVEAIRPMDMSHVEVHVSPTADFEATDETQIATFVSPYGGTYNLVTPAAAGLVHVALVAVNKSGIESEKSEEAAEQGGDIETPPDIEPDVAPTPEVIGGISMFHLRWEPVVNPSDFDVEVHVSPVTFTPTPGDAATLAATVSGTTTTIETLPSGAAFAPLTDYFFRLIAVNSAGASAPSAEVVGQLRQITTDDISVNAAWVGTLTADRIVNGELLADVVMVGSLTATGAGGEKVVLDADGFHVYGPTSEGNPVYIDFPTDGSKPNIISGVADMETLNVQGDPVTGEAANLHGVSSLAEAANLILASKVQSPVGKPTVLANYQRLQLNGTYSGFTPGEQEEVWGGYYNATDGFIYYVGQGSIRAIDPADGSLQFAQWLATDTVTSDFRGVCKIGTVWYLLVADGNDYYVERFDASWNWTARSLVINNLQRNGTGVGFGTDGTNLLLCYYDFGDGDKLHIMVRGPGVALISDDDVTPAQTFDSTRVFTQIIGGNFDYGAYRYIITTRNAAIWAYNAAFARQTNDEWPAYERIGAMVWDGTRFMQINQWSSSDSPWLVRYSTIKWTTESSTWWVQYTRNDTGGPYHTTASPQTSLTMKKRAFIQVTGNLADQDFARVYFGRGAAAPASSAMWRQSPDIFDPYSTEQYDAAVFSGNALNADAPTNTFPDATPATIESSDGSTFISGDGSVQVESRAIESTAWVAPTLLNSWVNFGSTWETAAYKKIDGVVYLRGLIKNGTTTAGTDLFVLPAGFRPTTDKHFIAVASNVIATVQVLADGTVQVGNLTTNTWLSLAGIIFPVD